MPEFTYTAIEAATGREANGTISALSHDRAVSELKAQGLALTSLALQGPPDTGKAGPELAPRADPTSRKELPLPAGSKSNGRGRIVRSKALMRFTRQLAMLLRAGLPLHRALEVLARVERNPPFRSVILGLAEAILAGNNLSQALRQSPRVFDELYVAMARAGEAGGVLDTVLDRLARFLERSERIAGRIKAALTYPIIILTVAGGIFAGLVTFVVPKFQLIFRGVLKGQALPVLTRAVLAAANLLRQHFVATAAGAVLLALAWRFARRTRRGRSAMDWMLLRTPVLGDLLLKASIARFTRTFGSLLASGVPLLDALEITRATSGNVHVEAALGRVHGLVQAGGTVARSLETTAVFPNLVTSMIEVGEQTGGLADVLGRVADAYDEEVDLAVAALTSIIEPIMIVFMALVVGVIVLALFLPIVGIVQHLQ